VLSSKLAKEVLAQMFETGEDPEVIVEKRGLKQITDENSLVVIVQEVFKCPSKGVRKAQSRRGKNL
jgi:aspartyl-tRNA(Asn)/glutamyl-tRNA(Gln) amidotransferase subunit B